MSGENKSSEANQKTKSRYGRKALNASPDSHIGFFYAMKSMTNYRELYLEQRKISDSKNKLIKRLETALDESEEKAERYQNMFIELQDMLSVDSGETEERIH